VTYFEAATRARAALVDVGVLPETATLDADVLARHVTGWDVATWLLRRSEVATDQFNSRYAELIQRRMQREPVAYIRGMQEFWGREFLVTPAVLIPRPETEFVVEAAVEFLRSHPDAQVADVGTGSGCIAISLALEHPAATVFAIDISAAALDVARQNAHRHEVADRIRFAQGQYLAGCPDKIDLMVSNPPYVAERDRNGLAPEVREYEPAVALFGGTDGWRDIRALLLAAATSLHAGGRLIMEMGYGQEERLADEVRAVSGLALDSVRNDLQGIPRVAVITRPRDV
jgi:release factor glutamine methyltransferase